MKHLYLAVEDQLSELVGSRLLHEAFGRERSFTSLQKNGNGYLRSRLSNFCEMGVHNVVLLITDLRSRALRRDAEAGLVQFSRAASWVAFSSGCARGRSLAYG